MAEKWIRVREAAKLWDVDRRTIQRWVNEGRIQGMKMGPHTMRILVETDEEAKADGVQGQAEEVRAS